MRNCLCVCVCVCYKCRGVVTIPLLMPPASFSGTPLCRLESTCFTIESTHDLLARLLVPVINNNIEGIRRCGR